MQSGYSKYSKDYAQRLQHNTLEALYPDLPDFRYDIIYADPPWHYNGKLQFDKSSKSREEIDLERRIFISTAGFKYPTLKLNELKKLNVSSIANDDCLLFMWTSNPHLAQAIELGQSWGFDYKTVGFVWDKMVHNPGQYTLSYCELCLIFKRGRIPRPRGARNVKQLVQSPRGKHSEKPEEVRSRIEAMFPEQRKIELFARSSHADWDSWGLDAKSMPRSENDAIEGPSTIQEHK